MVEIFDSAKMLGLSGGAGESTIGDERRRYDGAVAQEVEKQKVAAAENEAVRVQRLREDAARPMSVNLADGIELSRKPARFAGAGRSPSAKPISVLC